MYGKSGGCAGLLVGIRLAGLVSSARTTSHMDDVQWCTTCYLVHVVALVWATMMDVL